MIYKCIQPAQVLYLYLTCHTLNPYPVKPVPTMAGYRFVWVQVQVAPVIPQGYPCQSLGTAKIKGTAKGKARNKGAGRK